MNPFSIVIIKCLKLSNVEEIHVSHSCRSSTWLWHGLSSDDHCMADGITMVGAGMREIMGWDQEAESMKEPLITPH